MAIFLLFRFLGNVSGQSLTTLDKQKQKVILQLCTFVILIILNYFLIKSYGFIGAAIATLIAEIIIRIGFIIMDFKYMKTGLFPYLKILPSMIMAGLLMGVVIYFTSPYFHVILAILFGAVIYGFFLWIFRFFKPSDKYMLKQILPNKFKFNKQ